MRLLTLMLYFIYVKGKKSMKVTSFRGTRSQMILGCNKYILLDILLCHQYTAIRQWDMDRVCQARKASEHLPHEKPPPHQGNIVARQGFQHWGHVSCRSARHIHTAQTAQTPLATAHPPHARRPHPQRPPVRRAGLWKKTHRAATAVILQRYEAQHEGCRHQHRVLGEPGSQPAQVERSSD